MLIETVHLSQKAKEQLVKLKRVTGIQNWNVLCRWAFCTSLADKAIPPVVKLSHESAVEMTWKVFGGQHHEIYTALLKERCNTDGFDLDKETLSQQFKLHVHRGIGHLSGNLTKKNIDSLLQLTKQ